MFDAKELTDGLPSGDELKDPRVGDHEATVGEVTGPERNNSGSYAAVVKFTGLRDEKGRDFELSERVNMSNSDGSVDFQRFFLRTLHDFEIVPRDYKRAILIDTEEQAQKIVEALRSLVGSTIPIRVKEDDEGYVHANIRRRKK